MKRAKHLVLAFSSVVALGCSDRKSETPTPNLKPTEPAAEKGLAADNTGANERDREEFATTPTDQRENEADLKITQDLRKAVVDDESLSFNAKNAKIITASGVVTLRGPVKSEAEKATIEAKAKSVPGVTRVINLLEVEVNP